MDKNKMLIAGLVVLAIITGLVFFVNANDTPSDENTSGISSENVTTPTAPPPVFDSETPSPAESEDDSVDFVVEMSNNKFSPTVLTAAPGETINVKVVNKQGSHDFVIDELDVQSRFMTGSQEQTIQIKIPADAEDGKTYQFYCTPHKTMGMVGTLTVKTQ